MWSHPNFLRLCEELGRTDPERALSPGTKIARGFADLGYEEFLLLNGNKLLALYSGQVTQFPDEHRRFFFEVPTPDDIVSRITALNWDILTLEFIEQRSWRICMKHQPSGRTSESSGDTIEEALTIALLAIYNEEQAHVR
jgi:hypothetical protein